MTSIIKFAPEVSEIAKDLIPRCHTHLQNVPIIYLSIGPKPEKVHGSEALGSARLISGREAFFINRHIMAQDKDAMTEYEKVFIITVWREGWAQLKPAQRLALVDHELAHCWAGYDDKGLQMSILPHDLEEFQAIIERHGFYMPHIKAFADSVKLASQLSFIELEDKKDQGETKITMITPDQEVAFTRADLDRVHDEVVRRGKTKGSQPVAASL